MKFKNNLFSAENIQTSPMLLHDSYNRDYLKSLETYKSLNTYREFGVFESYVEFAPAVIDPKNWEGSEYKPDPTDPNGKAGGPGHRSIFNKLSSVLGNKNPTKLSELRLSTNTPLLDTPETRKKLREYSACSVKDLVEASRAGVFGTCTYDYSDFMYCSQLGKMPNNYLVTVRRFPVPVSDSMMPMGSGSLRKHSANQTTAVPISTMVTWLGVSGNKMEGILKYDMVMAFEEKNANWQQVEKLGGGDEGILNTLEATINPTIRKLASLGTNIPAINSFAKHFGLEGGQYINTYNKFDPNKVYGDVDRVKKSYARSSAGLDNKWKFNLIFEYELKAYNGINPKQAMLDLISNILACCYTNGAFWKGGYYGEMVPQLAAYKNLNIFKASGSATAFWDAIQKDVEDINKKYDEWKSENANSGTEEENSLDMNSEAVQEKIKSIANSAGGFIMGSILNKLGRPAKYYYPSLLSDAPVGLWHIVIGNPKRPIVTAGNMILTGTTIEHSGPLGLDDFPTRLKVTMSFDRGKPRDAWGIENMYMRGEHKITHSMDKYVLNMYKKSKKLGELEPIEPILKNDVNEGDAIQAEAPNTSSTTAAAAQIKTQFPDGATYVEGIDNTLMRYFGQADQTSIIMAAAELGRGHFAAPNEEVDKNAFKSSDESKKGVVNQTFYPKVKQ